jgi:ABC-2 type transport system permease protein
VTVQASVGGAPESMTPAPAAPAAPPPRPTRFLVGVGTVLRAQLAGARTARGALFVVATVQSVGIELLLRGVTGSRHDLTRTAIVAGSTVLVVAYVAVNLLAQRLGQFRHTRALDYYAALPVRPAAVVLGLAGSYAAFAAPGTVVTALVGAGVFGLPMGHLWVLVPVVLVAGASLAGLGALIGLLAPRPEVATALGQLAMTLVLFVGVIPLDRLPVPVQVVRAGVPSTYAVDALAESFGRHPDWSSIGWHLAGAAAVAVVALSLGGWAFRRAVAR